MEEKPLPKCEICRRVEGKWPCMRCGTWVCDNCINSELCIVCYANDVSVEEFGFSTEPKLYASRYGGFSRKIATATGFAVPVLPVIVGLIYWGLFKNERRFVGRIMARAGFVGTLFWAAVYCIYRLAARYL